MTDPKEMIRKILIGGGQVYASAIDEAANCIYDEVVKPLNDECDSLTRKYSDLVSKAEIKIAELQAKLTKAREALKRLRRASGHTTKCSFTGCNCKPQGEIADAYAQANEAYGRQHEDRFQEALS